MQPEVTAAKAQNSDVFTGLERVASWKEKLIIAPTRIP